MWNSLKDGRRRYMRSLRENVGACDLRRAESIVRDLGGCPPTCKARLRTGTCANKRDGAGGRSKVSVLRRVRDQASGLRQGYRMWLGRRVETPYLADLPLVMPAKG